MSPWNGIRADLMAYTVAPLLALLFFVCVAPVYLVMSAIYGTDEAEERIENWLGISETEHNEQD